MTENTQTYWMDLIDKYRLGTISNEERFQLERRALDDPFLFDALEGFALYEKAFKEIEKPKTTARLFTLPRIAIAASIVFLVAVMFQLNSDKKAKPDGDGSMAMVLEKKEKEDIAKDARDEILDIETVASTATSALEESIPDKSEVDAKSSKAAKAHVDRKKKIPPIAKAEEKISSSTKPMKEIQKGDKDGVEEIVVKGEEVENDGIFLVDGVSLILKEPTGKIETLDQDIIGAVDIVKVSNFENRAGQQKIEQIPIALESIAGVESSRISNDMEGNSVILEVAPVIGKKIFDDYAKELINERGLRQEKPQEVTIEFTIDKNGNLTDFHHIFTGCSECGSFAISILQNSGVWKTVPPGFVGKAKYTFIF